MKFAGCAGLEQRVRFPVRDSGKGFCFVLPRFVAFLAVLSSLAPLARPAYPQAAPPAPAKAAPAPAPAAPAQKAFLAYRDVNDLGLIRALEPLKLSSEQRDKFLALLRQIESEFKKRVDDDDAAMAALSEEIAKARQGALAGEPVDKELEARIGAAIKARNDRYAKARSAAIGRIVVLARTALTPVQKDHIEAESVRVLGGKRVPREFRADPSKAPKEAVQDLAVAAFAENVLLNDRSIEVLAALKLPPAGSAAAAAAPTAPAPSP